MQHGDDAVTVQAAKNLANKHPENTTLVKAGPDGALDGHIPATRGNVKVQVVGHGDVEGGKLGGADAPALARQIGQVKAQLGDAAAVEKVTLVGCQTACTTDAQPSLKQQVQAELAKQGAEVGEVTGRNTYVKVDAEGHKHDTTENDLDALPLKLSKVLKKFVDFITESNKVTPTPADLELAEYVAAKKEMGQPLPAEDVDALIRATETAREVQKNLKRGNVTTDLEETNRESRRNVAIGRALVDRRNWPEMATELERIDSRVIEAVAAEYMHSGNCGEHASCAFVQHGKRLRPDEKVARVSGKDFDHAFVMLEREGRPSIVIDAWQNGPAVLRDDFNFRGAQLFQVGPKMSYEDRMKYYVQRNYLIDIMSGRRSKVEEISRNAGAKFVDSNTGGYAPTYTVDWKRFLRDPRVNRVDPR
ncbi:hypothetical protein WM25_03990 [Burkholderia ubonensis]|nr:hypothetical protein WM25_03990 [Burkholderia ubonensis]